MSTTDEKNLLSHEYDGIREYDNPTPGWWKAIFLGTVIFSVAYWFYYHGGGPGLSEVEEYEKDMAVYREKMAAIAAEQAATLDESTLAAKAKDAQVLAKGKEVFLAQCQSCHTADGKGLVGPNLTDDHQIHGSTRMDIYQTIYDGVPAKGMISWGPVLPPEDLEAVTAYVSTLRHTNVPGGKAPEGEAVEPFAQ